MAVLAADRRQVIERVAVIRGGAEVAHDAPAVARSDRRRRLACATEPDGQRVLQWWRGDRGRAGHLPELSIERELTLGQRGAQELEPLDPPPHEHVVGHRLAERQADLARDAAPEAELEAAVAEGVERARLLGDAERVVERQHGDRGAEANLARPRRGGRQEEVWRGAGERAGVVLGDREAVEAELLGLDREVDEVEDLALLPARVVVVGGGIVGVESDAVGVDHLDPVWVIAELGHDMTFPALRTVCQHMSNSLTHVEVA